jgi:hypothetical protein
MIWSASAGVAQTKVPEVYTLKSAHEIRMRLEQEYGQISEIRRTTALHERYSLRKDKATSMDDHIRTFTKLQTMADYHRSATNPPLNKEGHLEAECFKKNRRDNNSNNTNNPSKNRDNPCSLCR